MLKKKKKQNKTGNRYLALKLIYILCILPLTCLLHLSLSLSLSFSLSSCLSLFSLSLLSLSLSLSFLSLVFYDAKIKEKYNTKAKTNEFPTVLLKAETSRNYHCLIHLQ